MFRFVVALLVVVRHAYLGLLIEIGRSELALCTNNSAENPGPRLNDLSPSSMFIQRSLTVFSSLCLSPYRSQ